MANRPVGDRFNFSDDKRTRHEPRFGSPRLPKPAPTRFTFGLSALQDRKITVLRRSRTVLRIAGVGTVRPSRWWASSTAASEFSEFRFPPTDSVAADRTVPATVANAIVGTQSQFIVWSQNRLLNCCGFCLLPASPNHCVFEPQVHDSRDHQSGVDFARQEGDPTVECVSGSAGLNPFSDGRIPV